ncbi:MAG TPA: hypothetical protein VFP21_08365 [Solirubrobacterales bacterium]|nr:hypothetical protein [Solirubrobacterales bacterium]
MVSIIALFVALGGTAWATHKIDSREIKAGAVTAAKIKNGAVTKAKLANGAVSSAKIVPNSVTGKQIDESTLGTVPSANSAASAATATTAERANSAATAANFDRYANSGVITAAIGQDVTVMQRGPFSFVGHCANGGGGAAEAFVAATTSQPGSTFSNVVESHSHADFDPGEENAVGPAAASVQAETNDTAGGYYSHFTALSADGRTRLSGEVTAAVNYFGSNCAFWGWTLDNG